MFYEELQLLKKHLENKCKVAVLFGDVDPGPNQLPVVRVLHTQKGTMHRYTEAGMTANLPIILQIIADRKSEAIAWRVMEEIFLNANSFNAEKGHTLDEDFQPAYEESIFTITIGYNLMLRYVKET